MLQTKFGDYPSIILVEDDIQGFRFFGFSGPLKGPIKLI
jgi:hypothetical protein